MFRAPEFPNADVDTYFEGILKTLIEQQIKFFGSAKV